MRARFFINGEEVNEPNNYQELSIQLNFDSDNPNAVVSTNEWELGVGRRNTRTDLANVANNHITNGLTGNVGVFEGMPFVIRVEDGQQSNIVFDGFLDLSNALVSCDLVTAPAIEQKSIDWLNEVADSFTFEYLASNTVPVSQGGIRPNDYTLVPYIISEIPNNKDVVIALGNTLVVTLQLRAEVQGFIEFLIKIGNPFETITGILQIIARITFIVALIITLVKFLQQVFNLIIQPVKYHAGMYALEQCQKAAKHLGLTFKSSILEGKYKELLILPEKRQQIINEDKDGILGFLKQDKTVQEGFYKGTFGDLLRQLKIMFNAKIILQGDVIRLEREDYNNSTGLYQIPDVDVDSYRFNSEDLKSNYTIDFSTDINDKNTINEYEGTSIQVQTLPKVKTNKGMVLNKGFEQINLQFALGKRKTEYTLPERIFLSFYSVADRVVNAINEVIQEFYRIYVKAVKEVAKIQKALKLVGIKYQPNQKLVSVPPPRLLPTFSQVITNRIGMLKMENDFLTVPKMLMITPKSNPINNILRSDNETMLSAEKLWNDYHSITSFDSQKYSQNNQYYKYSIDQVPFCFEDYQKVKENNKVIAPNGVDVGLIDSLEWNFYNQTASIQYRVNKVYTNNLKTQILIPNGK